MKAGKGAFSPETCILVPTHPGNAEASLLTVKLLDRHWPHHPPVFRIGMDPEHDRDLPFSGDVRSWIEVICSASRQLIEKGFQFVYLVLDDHPPVGPCHERHLNETLPSAMAALKACNLRLTGWDGMTHYGTEAVKTGVPGLRRLGPGFQFHFQLHPALWDLRVLDALSQRFLELGCKTAWDFERAARLNFEGLPVEWRQGGYIIEGRAMMADGAAPASPLRELKTWAWRRLDKWSREVRPVTLFPRRHIFGYCLRNYLRLGRRDFRKLTEVERMQAFAGRFFGLPPENTREMRGGDFRKVMRRWLGFDRCLYEGPYPIYRNGFLIRGVLNPLFIEHLRKTGQEDVARELTERFPS